MNTFPLRLTAVGIVLALGLTACGGGDEPSAQPTPSPSETTTSATPTPSPSPTAAPTGKFGVTYEITNWDQYGTDPVVQAWKETYEGLVGSVNRRQLQPGVRERLRGPALRNALAALDRAWRDRLTHRKVAQAKVESVKPQGASTRLTMCLWGPTARLVKPDGTRDGGNSAVWERQAYTFRRQADLYVMTRFDAQDSNCPGGPPR